MSFRVDQGIIKLESKHKKAIIYAENYIMEINLLNPPIIDLIDNRSHEKG